MRGGSRSITQWHLRQHPEKIARFEKVRIWSNEWRLWWRPGGEGYTSEKAQAGIYDAKDALRSTIHCGPEKKIILVAADE